MTEKQSYLEYIERLAPREVHFFFEKSLAISEEAVYAELNRMRRAVDQPDEEVLGKYSPKVK